MKWKQSIKMAGIGAVLGYILTVIIANVVFEMIFQVNDDDFTSAISAVILGPIGATIGAIIGGVASVLRSAGKPDKPDGTSELPAFKPDSSGKVNPGRNLWRTITIIAAGIAGAAGGITLWYWFWLNLPSWFGEDNIPDVVIYLYLAIGSVLVIVMPPISAGLGALAGAKFVLRFWPQPGVARAG